METHIDRYVKLGTLLWMSFPGLSTLAALERIASDCYFEIAELSGFFSPEERRQITDIAAQSHLELCYGAQPLLISTGLNPNHVNEADRQIAQNLLTKAVDEAFHLGIKTFDFFAGKWEKESFLHSYDALLRTTRAVCIHAAEKDIRINLEVFDYDVDKASLIGPATLAARFASDVNCANFGLTADLSHFPLTRETPEEVIGTLAPYLKHFHIGNAVTIPGASAYGDQHPRFGYPNSANDTTQLAAFFSALNRYGFFRDGQQRYPLSFEVRPRENESPDLVLAGSKRTLAAAWSLA